MYEYSPVKIRSGSISGSGIVKCDTLKGLNATETVGKTTLSRADGKSYYTGSMMPGMVNMIRTGSGEVSKRPGYNYCYSAIGNIKASYVPADKELGFFAVENNIIVTDGGIDSNAQVHAKIPTDSNFTSVKFASIDKYVFIMGGKSLMVFDTDSYKYFFIGGTLNTVNNSEQSYLPTVFIGCKPNGAGAAYEAVNMINPFVAEQFISDGVSLTYTLHLECAGDIQVYFKTATGKWKNTTYKSYTSTTVTLTEQPTETVAEGEDNVRIVYRRKDAATTLNNIGSCKCAAEFGVAGYKDRAFLSASESQTGIVYYSDMNNPLYFPDVNYIRVGSADTHVMALAGQNTDLAVICNDNVYTISGVMSDADYDTFGSEVKFVINGIFKTPQPVGVIPPVIFDNEIVYLTREGICAITASGVLDERCCQIRSSNLHAHLLNEDLSECELITMEDFLIITNKKDRLYIFDGKQFSLESNDSPFSMRVYEGYIWTEIQAVNMWLYNDTLYFSSSDSVYFFNKGFRKNTEYRDERGGIGNFFPIKAYWETPYMYCGDFYLNKFFDRLGVLIGGDYGEDGYLLNTDIKILAKFDNEPWRMVKDYDGSFRIFRYDALDFARFAYGNRIKDYSVYKRLLHKKGRGIKLRFESEIINEPFTLKQFGIEYQIM